MREIPFCALGMWECAVNLAGGFYVQGHQYLSLQLKVVITMK